MEPVKDRVGTSREVTASDPDNFRANVSNSIISSVYVFLTDYNVKLEEYLSSSTGNSNTAKVCQFDCEAKRVVLIIPQLWPLVSR
jgi:hypothetical protein